MEKKKKKAETEMEIQFAELLWGKLSSQFNLKIAQLKHTWHQWKWALFQENCPLYFKTDFFAKALLLNAPVSVFLQYH